MRVLLDTHAFLWWIADSGRLSVAARQVIADEANHIVSSPMQRPFALLAFLALSWSHVAAVRCATGGSTAQGPAEAPMAHHHEASHPTGEKPSHSHPHEDPGHGECAMMLACAVTSGEPLRPADIRSFPGVAFRAGPFVQQVPAIVVSSVDPPPPRHDI